MLVHTDILSHATICIEGFLEIPNSLVVFSAVLISHSNALLDQIVLVSLQLCLETLTLGLVGSFRPIHPV